MNDMKTDRFPFGVAATCSVMLAVAVGCSREVSQNDSSVSSVTNATISRVVRTSTRQETADGGKRAKHLRKDVAKVARSARKSIVATEDRTDLSPTDKKTLLAVEKALEDENVEAARAVAGEALKATSAEVRSECVDMLGWFGEKTLAELTPFLSDPDKDVAENALSTWTRSLGEIEDETTRCRLVEGVMTALRDADALESLVMEVDDCDDALTMQLLVDLIGGNNEVAAKVAREHYEFKTGEEFTSVEAAEKWLKENKSEEED